MIVTVTVMITCHVTWHKVDSHWLFSQLSLQSARSSFNHILDIFEQGVFGSWSFHWLSSYNILNLGMRRHWHNTCAISASSPGPSDSWWVEMSGWYRWISQLRGRNIRSCTWNSSKVQPSLNFRGSLVLTFSTSTPKRSLLTCSLI